ncbi:MAG: hypothetical protein QXO03_04205 [Thermoplasmatales archaeon]
MIKYSSSYFVTGRGEELFEERRGLLKYLKKLGIRAEGKRYADIKIRNKFISGNVGGIYLDPESTSHLIPISRGYLFNEKGT